MSIVWHERQIDILTNEWIKQVNKLGNALRKIKHLEHTIKLNEIKIKEIRKLDKEQNAEAIGHK